MSPKGKNKKSSGRKMSKKYFGGTRDSFGKKKKKDSWTGVATFLLLILTLGGALIYWLANQQSQAAKNTSTVTLFQEESFDSVKDYKAIRDNGTISQLNLLLNILKSKDLSQQFIPVQLENDRQIIEIAERVIDHAECEESDRNAAYLTKMDAHWHSYIVSQKNNLKDPFIAEQFFAEVDRLLQHPNKRVAKHAEVLRARAIVIQTVRKQFLGSEQAVSESITSLLKKYPNDPAVNEVVKKLFTDYRAFDSEGAVRLAGKLAPFADLADAEGGKRLSRFMKDIIALYDSGIGNTKTIASIIVNDQDFMQRLLKLNELSDTGPTVVVQLDNAIEFFERERKYELAKQLCQDIAAKAELRTVPESKELAQLISKNGLDRLALVDQKWKFDGVDSTGNEIVGSRYADRVVMVVYYELGDSKNVDLFAAMSSLRKTIAGRNVDFICVGVDTGIETDSNSDGVPQNFLSILTSQASPDAFLLQCPTRRFPYAVLIGKQGHVDSINVTLSTVRTRIEYLSSSN